MKKVYVARETRICLKPLNAWNCVALFNQRALTIDGGKKHFHHEIGF